MAEISTVARPYAEALFQVARAGDLARWSATVTELAGIGGNAQMRTAIDDPKITDEQIFGLFTGLLATPLSAEGQNFVRALIANGRLTLLPEIARQFAQLKNAQEGVADADIISAFPMPDAQVAELIGALEKKFGIKLRAKVAVDSSLIGGVRVTVGDEVLDSSVRTRLEQMRVALTA